MNAARAPFGALLMAFTGALGAVLPLSTDSFSPALTAIAGHFGQPPAAAKLLITGFVLGFGAAHLAVGPLMDRFGRRPVIIASLLGLATASAVSMQADSLGWLTFWRFLQGALAAAGTIGMRTIVRDRADPLEATRILAAAGAGVAAAAIISPFLSHWLIGVTGWRAVFGMTGAYAALLSLALIWGFPETAPALDKRALSPARMWRVAREVTPDRRFLGNALAGACGYAGLLQVLSALPFIMTRDYPALAAGPAIMVAAGGLGFLTGSLGGAQLLRRFRALRTGPAGCGLFLAAGLLALALPPGLPWLWTFFNVFLFTVGWALVQPWANVRAIIGAPEEAGRVSAMLGLVQMAGGSAIAIAIGGLIVDRTALGLAWTALSLACFACLSWGGRPAPARPGRTQ